MRRAAIIVTAVVVPMVVVLIVLAHVLGGRDNPSSSPAEVSGTSKQRADLPVLPVDVPPVTPAEDAACPGLMKVLPLDLMGEPSRRVDSASPFAYAWGDPPVVLVCGVDRPAGWVVGESAIQINGVQWYVDTHDPDTTVWTAVDRSVYVEVRVPSSIDSGPVTALTTHIAQALPYQEPRPGQ